MTELGAVLGVLPRDGLHGRRMITTDKRQITAENVAEVVQAAYAVHLQNRREIQYLYDFYRGKQDVRCRKKQIRPEILNIVMANRANEIVTFKVSYLLGAPMQYISKGSKSELLVQLNNIMAVQDKAAKDKEVADWVHIAGVGYRFVARDPLDAEEPLRFYTLDPRDVFVIRYSGIGNAMLAGCIIQRDEDGQEYVGVYTKQAYFELRGDDVRQYGYSLGRIPVVEYLHNSARMGAFEIVLPILNAINTLESNRVDDIEQFVQSILVFKNCELPAEDVENLLRDLGIQIKDSGQAQANVFRVDGALDQNGVQTVVDDLYETVLTICGMPNRNGGSSTSDTGAATIMRDGWSAAESRARDTELLWCRSEREFLRTALDILRISTDLDLSVDEVGIKFPRRNHTDIQSKAQVLAELLNNQYVHPLTAWQVSDLVPDTEEAYRAGMQWNKEQQQKLEESLNVRAIGRGDPAAEQTDGTEVPADGDETE